MSQLKVNTIRHTGASSDAITLASDGTATAKITNNLSNRNLVINGGMNVAQYGQTSGSSGFRTVDRFAFYGNGLNAAVTVAQADVASGTTPYTLGFRKSHKITNGAQTGPDAGDYIYFSHKIEAQNMATSGWNYTSASSYVTLSFWVKSSVAQNFYGYLKTSDGTSQNYPFETGSLSANTWTKITKTIPGHANIQFDINTEMGVEFVIAPFFGTDKTGTLSLNAWGTWSSSNRLPDNTSTWFTTDGATFEYTGVQLEVSDHATEFEMRSYDDELARCQRYYQRWEFDADKIGVAVLHVSSNDTSYSTWKYYKPLRSSGSDTTFSYSGASDFDMILDGSYDRAISGISMSTSRRGRYQSEFVVSWSAAGSSDECASLRSNGSSGWLAFSAEL